MKTDAGCSECGAVWQNQVTCRDHFHQMLAWEFENSGGAARVHHLTVLCYNLQHPHVYSPEALTRAISLLARYVVDGATPQQIRVEFKQTLASGTRSFKITAAKQSMASYARRIVWPTTISEVAMGGLEGYCERVGVWAQSVHDALLASGNYSP